MSSNDHFVKCGFVFESSVWKKQLSDKMILIRDPAKRSWQVDMITSEGNVNVIPYSRIKDDEIKDIVDKEIHAVNELSNAELMKDVKTIEPSEDITKCTEIVTLPAPVGVSGIVRPAVTKAEAVAAWHEFQSLKSAILSRSDLQHISGRDYVKKSGWRKLATFYNLTDRIVEERQIPLDKGDYYWKIKVECTAPNGRVTEGVGICASTERKFSHPEHDIYATAHTRAKNRSISDMIAAGDVSAEELGEGGL